MAVPVYSHDDPQTGQKVYAFKMFEKRKFIYALIVISLLLIIFNILLEVTSKKEVKTIQEVSINEIEIEIEDLKYGIYLIKIFSSDKELIGIKKLVIE